MNMHYTLAVLALIAGCQNDTAKTKQLENLKTAERAPTDHGSTSSAGNSTGAPTPDTAKPAPGSDAKDIDSKDILARSETSADVYVKHVLLAWKDLESTYHGRLDPRAAKRTNAEAADLAQDLAKQLRASPDKIDALVKQYSEDPGSQAGDPYEITKDTPFVPELKQLAMRLKDKEVGIVKTTFGYHVIERVAPPTLDPLESADILSRPARDGEATIQHVMIGWKDAPGSKQVNDPRAMKRTKADADKAASDVFTKAKAGEDFVKLMKESSEDPETKDGKTYDVDAASPLPFAKLAVRLKDGEIGMIKSPFGWHVVKRLPPDPLESSDILKREPVTQKAKVKHILLGWKERHTEDPRGLNRDHAAIAKLVTDTVAKLKKGEKIEPLMKELSEDQGSAKSGESYPVDPSAGLVKPFKDLSLRLNVGEVGVVETQFGFHIIQRVE